MRGRIRKTGHNCWQITIDLALADLHFHPPQADIAFPFFSTEKLL